jgi:uncharacterized protein YigA (DUF484 family)
MSKVIDFQANAVARLRARVAALDEANADLLAYARGHTGAVAQIHAAALAALDAQDFDHLIHVVTQDWVDILSVDAVALAVVDGAQAIRAGAHGLQVVDGAQLAGLLDGGPDVLLRAVPRGAEVFGPAADLIRSEALIRLRPSPPLPVGILALGAREMHNFEGGHGGELLAFLGSIVARMIDRWLPIRP